MHTPKNGWDVERAAAWLRKHTWGAKGEEGGPAPDPSLVAEAQQAQARVGAEGAPEAAAGEEQEEIDIAGWPALVAPFYD